MTKYDMLKNAQCDVGSPRDRWLCLGRTQATQWSAGIDENGRLFTWGNNYDGQCGQGDPGDDGHWYEFEFATQLLGGRRFTKFGGGEGCAMALEENGQLWAWGANYSEWTQWGYPQNPVDPDAFVPVQVAPGYLWSDFAFCGYLTLAVSLDKKLYTFGDNDYWGLGAGLSDFNYHGTPILNPYITEDIKFVDTELFNSAVVTVNNKVWVFGTSWWTNGCYPDFNTKLNALNGAPYQCPDPPAGEIIGMSCAGMGVLLTYADGTVWKLGNDGMLMDGTSPWGSDGDIDNWQQVTALAGKNIVKATHTSLGSFAIYALDDEGNIWGYSDSGFTYWKGNSLTYTPYTMMLVGADEAGNRKYIDFGFNEHNLVYQAIDDRGYLWVWGYQYWGAHFAMGFKSWTSTGSDDLDDYPRLYSVQFPELAAQAIDYRGELTTLNLIDQGVSDYVQPIGQTLAHRPCGHWHLRLFEGGEDYPKNCWMPSLAMRSGELLFVAAGKHFWADPETGNEILFFSYDIGSNVWSYIGYDDMINAANHPGGADFRGNLYGFANYKVDQIGSQFNEAWDNAAIGVWVVNSSTGVMEYNEFTNINPSESQSIANKLGVFSTGVVAVAYKNSSNQIEVQVSTDSGATFVSRKTVSTSYPDSFSLLIDENGYIFLAYQVSSSAVKVERSIDNGLNWTTQVASNTLGSTLQDIKMNEDAGYLFLIGNTTGGIRVEHSSNQGVTWGSSIGYTHPDYFSIVAHACYIGTYDHCVAYQGMQNYRFEADGQYYWTERTLQQINGIGEWVDVNFQATLSALVGSTGTFAYAGWGFFTEAHRAVAIALTLDQGQHWFLRETPLKYYTDYTELGDFDGDPLFYLTDMPKLNPTWTFQKSDWADTFVKQKDKY